MYPFLTFCLFVFVFCFCFFVVFYLFCFTSASSCLVSSSLPSTFIIMTIFLAFDEDNFLSKALVFPCVTSYRRISVFSNSPVDHSFLRKILFSFIFMKSHR